MKPSTNPIMNTDPKRETRKFLLFLAAVVGVLCVIVPIAGLINPDIYNSAPAKLSVHDLCWNKIYPTYKQSLDLSQYEEHTDNYRWYSTMLYADVSKCEREGGPH